MYRLNPGQRNNRDHRLFSRKNKQREGRDLGVGFGLQTLRRGSET